MATWYENIVAAHLAVTDNVSHGQRMKSERYFVWMEDGRNDLESDNMHGEKSIVGTTDLYTKRELDPWAELFEDSLDSSEIAWRKILTDFEEETGFWHHEWEWNVCGNTEI